MAEIKKALKSDSLEAETKEKLHIANSIITEEKALKSEIKKLSIQLENKTKETIENLTDEQAVKLLKEKWIFPLVQNLMKMPDSIINVLTDKVEYLAKKYETTLESVEEEIVQTEKELCSMIEELNGDEYDMLGLNELKKLLGGE